MTDDLSHDPRSWAAPSASAAPPPATPPRRDRRLPLALAGSALVLVAGAATAWLSRAPHVVETVAAVAPHREAAPLSRRTLVLPDPANLARALADVGVDPADARAAADAILARIGGRKGALHLAVSLDKTHLARLEASFDDSSGAVATREPAGTFTASSVEASLQSEIRVVKGEMDSASFYSSAVAAGVTDTLIPQIAKALAFDFDFQRDIKPGDVFEIASEQMRNSSGQLIGTPRLLFVSLTTQDKSRSLYAFQPAGEDAGWFDGNGASIIRTLMRTPVDGARVSSTFGMRVHPIQGFMKMHKGVDFAAPIGTPIYASGDAVIEFSGPKGPNGNFVKLRHPNGWETLYLHLNRFADGMAVGGHVRQGQEIGEVGTTGNSTGPHLHYELHVDDEPVDPSTVPAEQGRTLAGSARDTFLKERDRIDVARARQVS